MAVLGKCKLCLLDGVELQDSHYLSKGIYKKLRNENAKNPNPVLITKTKIVQTSSQLRRRLLCKVCEDRLNSGGEAWVLKHCLQADGKFPLRDILSGRTPDLQASGAPTRVYGAGRITEISVSKIAYFATSIFWRGTLHGWNDDGSIPVDLGPFEERFRKYLVGEESFPINASLWVMVREGGGIQQLTYTPLQERVNGLRTCKFPMPGLAFVLIVSKNTPASHRSMCFVNAPGNPIFLTPALEPLLLDESVRALTQQRKRAG
jgi:hypothetical protein